MPQQARPRRSAVALGLTGGLLVTAGLTGIGPTGAVASSHREAPLIAGEPEYDNTDTYAFRSADRTNTVTLAANWIPFEDPAGGPNFYSFATDARYDINVDNDGDAQADIVFRWKFQDHYRSKDTFLYNNGEVTGLYDKNLNFYQTYRLRRINVLPGDDRVKVLIDKARVAPSHVGEASMPNYRRLRNQAVRWTGTPRQSAQSFAGQAEDPFFLDLRVFDLLYGGDLSEVGNDTLAGYNVNSVALQIARRSLAAGRAPRANPVIGVWSTTDRRGADGTYRQVSRLGNPLVNEVVIPLKDKDRFNASEPAGDARFLTYVVKPELAALLNAFYQVGAPENGRADLVSVFLTGVAGINKPANVVPSEQLRLNMDTPVTENPDRLGVLGGDLQGYPNGRRLTDDVIDISLQAVAGELVGNPNDLGDAVNTNDATFAAHFPYLALPVSGSAVNGGQNAAQSSSLSGYTALNGGSAPDSAVGSSSASQVPVSSIALVALGLVALAAAGAAAARRPGVASA